MFAFTVNRGTFVKQGVYIFGGYNDSPSGVDAETPYGFDTIINYDGSSVTTESVALTDKMFGNTSANIKSDIYIFGGYTKQVLDPDPVDNPLPCTNKIQRYDGNKCVAVSSTINARWSFGSAALNGEIFLFGGVTSPMIFPYSAHLWVGTEKFTGSATVVLSNSVSFASGNVTTLGGVILDFDKSNSRIIEYYGGAEYGATLLSGASIKGTPGVIGANAYLFGGYRSSSGGYVTTSKIKKWNGSALSEESVTVNWDNSNCSVSTYKGKAYVIGGKAYRSFPDQEFTILNTISSYDGSTWVAQAATLPSVSQMHSSTSLSK